MQDNRGKRPSPISMDKAFAVRSTHGSAMRCGACHFWSCGWCSLKASMTSEQAFACNYGSRKREAVRTSIKGMKEYESKRKKPISSPDRVEWPKKPKTRSQEPWSRSRRRRGEATVAMKLTAGRATSSATKTAHGSTCDRKR